MPISPDLIDIDFSGDFRSRTLTRETPYGQMFQTMADTGLAVIPRSQWPELCEAAAEYPLERNVQRIMNQSNEGSCASNAAAQCMETISYVQGGADLYVSLSAISLYKQVASSAGSGSTIDGNLRALQQTGILPLDTIDNRARFTHVMPHTGFGLRYPEGWKDTAKRFRADEWIDLNSFEEVATASFLGFPICYGRAGHAICGVRTVKQGNGYFLRYANSWRESWGENGYGYDSEGSISGSIRLYGAWGLRSIIIHDLGGPSAG